MSLTPDEQRLRERLTRYGSLNTDDSWMAIAIIDAERERAEKAEARVEEYVNAIAGWDGISFLHQFLEKPTNAARYLEECRKSSNERIADLEAELVAARGAAKPLAWRNDPPDCEGIWLRMDRWDTRDGEKTTIDAIEVIDYGGVPCERLNLTPVSKFLLEFRWAGPIPQPQEPIDPYGPMPGSEDEGNLSEGGK